MDMRGKLFVDHRVDLDQPVAFPELYVFNLPCAKVAKIDRRSLNDRSELWRLENDFLAVWVARTNGRIQPSDELRRSFACVTRDDFDVLARQKRFDRRDSGQRDLWTYESEDRALFEKRLGAGVELCDDDNAIKRVVEPDL